MLGLRVVFLIELFAQNQTFSDLFLVQNSTFMRKFPYFANAPCIRRRGMKDNFVLFIHSLCILPFWKPWDPRR